MKVIFIDTVQGVAIKGDIKIVKPGFFRNYLQPYRKAVPATDMLIKQWEERCKKMLIEKQELKAKLEEISRRLAGVSLKLSKKVTKKGTLYGGVKPANIVDTIKTQLNIEIPESSVVLPAQIKTVGTYEITLKLGEGVETKVPLEIVPKEL